MKGEAAFMVGCPHNWPFGNSERITKEFVGKPFDPCHLPYISASITKPFYKEREL
jgi:hypothetical protein